MVRGKPHSAQAPALRPLTRVLDLRCGDEMHESGGELRGSSAVDKISNVNRYSCSGIASLTVLKLCTPCHYSCGGDKHRNAHRVRKYSHTIYLICAQIAPRADIHVFGVNKVSVGVNTCIA